MKNKISLAKKKCLPCESGAIPLSRQEAFQLLQNLRSWRLSADEKSIECEWVMKDFMAAVTFVRKIAGLAEKENHHPDLHLTGYRRLRIQISTHAIGGLSDNDFILAAKIDRIPKKLKS